MGKIQVESGQSSSTTHRLTQSSTTLNRRYVKRPTSRAVEEAARRANHPAHVKSEPTAAPSRLVNLRVHSADLEAARAAEEASEAADIIAHTQAVTLFPQVVEMGSISEPTSAEDITEAVADVPIIPETSAPKDETEVDTTTLAMNIAADYAAASLSASAKEADSASTAPIIAPADDSISAIATAASEAIASIRTATDSGQVSEQVASLKAFADNIKSRHDSREMRELSDTIDKFVSIAMKSTKVQEEAANNVAVTLTPKVNRAADKVAKSSAKIIAATPAKAKPSVRPVAANRNVRRPVRKPVSSAELKDRAIEKALHSVATMDETNASKRATHPRVAPRKKLRAHHVALALTCAAACVAGVIYLVGKNIPDISVRVAAMQTGIQATYPSYIPRDYSLGNINSENGKLTMTFDGPDNTSFELVEEKSSWDSSALLRNYVEPTWGDEYVATHEQGITIYISNSNSNAAWVNGGILYKITSSGNVLTKKQVRSIVTSL